jgi:hypothetical protein
MLAALLALGCIPPFLVDAIDIPFVLATGLGEIHSLAIGPDRTLLAATDRGLVSIDAEGHVTPAEHERADTRAVTAFPRGIVALTSTGIALGAAPPLPRARDIAAGWFDELLAVTADELLAVREDGGWRVLARGLGDARAVAIGAREGSALVVAGDALVEVTYGTEGGGTTYPVAALPSARAVAVGRTGRIVLAGSGGVYEVRGGASERFARVKGVHDLVFAELVPGREDLFAAVHGAVVFWRAGD